jgi:aerobic C4-dicarboxylate transport protein
VNADPSQLKTTEDASTLVEAGEHTHWWDFVLRIVPDSVVAPFAEGEILKIISLRSSSVSLSTPSAPSVPRS